MDRAKGFPAACGLWATLLLFTVPSEMGLCNTAQWQPDVAVVTDVGVISMFACLSFGSYWLKKGCISSPYMLQLYSGNYKLSCHLTDYISTLDYKL